MQVISFSNAVTKDRPIDISAVRQNVAKIKAGLIQPASEEVSCELAGEHTAEPIKRMEDIQRITDFLVSQERWRDNMLFIVGINFGLRVSDLRLLRFSHLINDNLTFKDRFAILEQKTKNTRNQRKNRYITINNAVIDAVTLYLENTPDVKLSDYMFRSMSNNGSYMNLPIHRNSVDRILKGIAKDLDLDMKVSTHTLRKTFCFHQMAMSGNDPRKLLLLQKILGHASIVQTLDYIGVTQDEISEAYLALNLGSRTCNYLIDSHIGEMVAESA